MKKMKTKQAADLTVQFNNKGLKKLFPKSHLTKKELRLAPVNADHLNALIREKVNSELYDSYQIIDIELEGQYNDWELAIKIELTYK